MGHFTRQIKQLESLAIKASSRKIIIIQANWFRIKIQPKTLKIIKLLSSLVAGSAFHLNQLQLRILSVLLELLQSTTFQTGKCQSNMTFT